MSLLLQDSGLLKTQAYINGAWLGGNDNHSIDVNNPATGEIISSIAVVGANETHQAIVAAEDAMKNWRLKSAKQRAVLLRSWFDLIMAAQDDLAKILTAEQGKPLAEAKAEIAYGASYIEWFAEEGKRIYGDVIPSTGNDKRIVCIKQPIGVVACITPWNFPNAMLTRKIAPALAAGCTVVCKPASETPLSALALAELANRAGIPAGVINIVVGSSQKIGPVLTGSSIIRKLTFTGSTAVGKQLIKECASTVKKTSMELGGNAPFIVFDDADLDAAIAGALICKYRNAGQTCVCANRFLVQEGIYNEFIKRFAAAVANLKIGNGADKNTNFGPMVNEKAVANMQPLVQNAVDKGADLLIGGKPTELGSCYYPPTILTNVNESMRVFREEIFGPIAPILKFKTEQDAISMANDTEFGLASYFYTRDIGRVWRVAEALDFGIIGINEGIVSNEAAPFGGVKESGNGREGSKYGIDDYTEIKYMCMGGIDRVSK